MKALSELNSKSIKYVFTDIDDTLTNDGQLISESYEAMWRLNNNNIKDKEQKMEGNPFASLAKRPESTLAKVERWTLKALYYGLIPAIIIAGKLCIIPYNHRLIEKTKKSLR